MAKTIKFNLICDGKPIRTIEDLQNNFSIEDVLAYYSNQLLHRWLKVRGYEEELKAVNAIACSEPIDIIKELISIFDVAADMNEVEENIYILRYLKERQELYAIYERENNAVEDVIADYEAGYRQLVSNILENPNDVAVVKASIAEIVSHYARILRLNHRELFWILSKESYLAVMCLLMNKDSRGYYLPVRKVDNERGLDEYEAMDPDKKHMFDAICKMTTSPDFAIQLGSNLHSFSGETDGYWKDLEPKGKYFMIISMDVNDNVRSAGRRDENLSSSDVMNNFVIVDGIDYRSNSMYHELKYMEV